MANAEHLEMLNQGVGPWNEWRKKDRLTVPQLSSANFEGRDLSGINLSGCMVDEANLRGANLSESYLYRVSLFRTDLSGADLRGAQMRDAELTGAIMKGVCLEDADLKGSVFTLADFSGANLTKSDMCFTNLVCTNFSEATINDACIYGISAWDVNLYNTKQNDLIISQPIEGVNKITVDNLEVAQFVYLITTNSKLRDVIDTMRTRTVLILSSFATESIRCLEIIKTCLRSQGFIPMVFDFDPPATQHLLETIKTMAMLASFVLIDLTTSAGQYIEYASLNDVYAPVITIASEEAPITKMVKKPSEYWFVDEPIRYDRNNALEQIPFLLKTSIIPTAKRINEKLLDDRKSFNRKV